MLLLVRMIDANRKNNVLYGVIENENDSCADSEI